MHISNIFIFLYVVPFIITGVLGFVKSLPDGLGWALSAFALAVIPGLNIASSFVIITSIAFEVYNKMKKG